MKIYRKRQKKTLIHLFTAAHSKATSETRKQVVHEMEKESTQKVKTASEQFLDAFSNSAKGKWSKAAHETFKETGKTLEKLN